MTDNEIIKALEHCGNIVDSSCKECAYHDTYNASCFEKYLILYSFDDHWFYTENAVSAKDCLIQFLDHTGNNEPLIRKALNGMETEEEMVELINAMTTENIEHIYKIDKVVYGEKSQ